LPSIHEIISYKPESRKLLFRKLHLSEHLNTDQSQLTKRFALVACFACCSLGDYS